MMYPQVEFGKFYEVETDNGTEYVPFDAAGPIDDMDKLSIYCEGKPQSFNVVEGWGARLDDMTSMDCTPWTLYETEEQATTAIADEFFGDEFGYVDLESLSKYLTLSESYLRECLESVYECSSEDDQRKIALMLVVGVDTFPDSVWGNCFRVGQQEYLVLDNDEADEQTAKYVEESLWAFSPAFLSGETGFDQKVFDKLSEDCEDSNDAILTLVEKGCGLDQFVEAAIDADGRGHFLSGYDGEEVESKDYFIYRLN